VEFDLPDPSSLPRYIQISEVLIRDIMGGRLLDGAKLPPEKIMAESLGIAVGTLRKALDILTNKGLVERVQGSGNYIRHRQDIRSVYALFRLELIGGGGLPRAQVLSIDRLPKPVDAPDFGQSAQGHRIRRLRYLDATPVAMEEIWLDQSYVQTLLPSDLSESLYLFYRQRLNLWIMRIEDQVSLARMPDWSHESFEIGAACGFIERISWAQNEARAEYSRTWFDTEKARYIARLQ